MQVYTITFSGRTSVSCTYNPLYLRGSGGYNRPMFAHVSACRYVLSGSLTLSVILTDRIHRFCSHGEEGSGEVLDDAPAFPYHHYRPFIFPQVFSTPGHPHLCYLGPRSVAMADNVRLETSSNLILGLSYIQYREPTLQETGTWNTLLTGGENSSQTSGFGGKDAGSRYRRLAEEAQHIIIGPMPVELFLDVFMDREAILKEFPNIPPVSQTLFAALNAAQIEAKMYVPLVSDTHV